MNYFLNRGSRLTIVLSLFLFLPAIHGEAQEEDPAQRMVFFDVFVVPSLTELAENRIVLSRGLGAALSRLPGVQVIDQGTRDSLMLQRKLNLEDCNKAECRFAMVKALPGIDLMLEAEISPFGGKNCSVFIQVKSMKKGTIESSRIQKTSCEFDAVFATIEQVGGSIWPPPGKAQAAAVVELPKGDLSVEVIPADARVNIDGTELELENGKALRKRLTEGDHEIKVSHADFAELSLVTRIMADGVKNEKIKLTPKPGKLKIVSVPNGVALTLDGQESGITPKTVALPPGRYRIAASKNGYQPSEKTVDIKANREVSLEMILEAVRVPKTIVAEPATAKPPANESTSAGSPWTKQIARYGGLGLSAVGVGFTLIGNSTATRNRTAYDKRGKSQDYYDTHYAGIKSGNQITYTGFGGIGLGLVGFGVSWAID